MIEYVFFVNKLLRNEEKIIIVLLNEDTFESHMDDITFHYERKLKVAIVNIKLSLVTTFENLIVHNNFFLKKFSVCP